MISMIKKFFACTVCETSFETVVSKNKEAALMKRVSAAHVECPNCGNDRLFPL